MYGIVGKFWVLGNTGTVAACLYFYFACIPQQKFTHTSYEMQRNGFSFCSLFFCIVSLSAIQWIFSYGLDFTASVTWESIYSYEKRIELKDWGIN
jgi:hypothetical protein